MNLKSEKKSQPYYLLPFRFQRINRKELIVNEFGDYLLLPKGSVERIIKKEINKFSEKDFYADLVSNCFVSESPIPQNIEIMATRYRTKKSFLNDFTGLHIIVPTLRCNQACHYCQVSHVTKESGGYDIDNKTIDNIVEIIFKSPNPNITIEFQGGEPLLVFDKIQYCIEKVKEYLAVNSKKLTYVICTNLFLLDENILNYCKLNNIQISTSLDGPEFIHNYNRKNQNSNSYKVTIENIFKCREVLGYDKVSALMTTSKYSLNYHREIIDEYLSHNFKEIFLRVINPYGHALKNRDYNEYTMDDFFEFYKKALNYIIELNRNGIYFVEVFTKLVLTKMLTPFPIGFVDLQSPAGIINNVIVYNYNGNVYPSDEARMIAEMGDDYFNLGNINKNNYKDIFNGEKANQIAEHWSNECLVGCSECAFQAYCGADPIRNYSTQGDMYGFRPTSTFCKKNKMIFEYLIELIDSNSEIEKIFNRWISNKEN